jgi:membrane protein required for colicin V production
MTWLDIVVVATVVLSAIYGFWKGLIRAVLGIAGLLGGFFVAGLYYQQLAAKLWPDGALWTSAAAYVIILVAVLAAAALVAGMLSRLIHMTPLGIIDRVLGLAAGLVVAALGWALVFTIILATVPGADATLGDSELASELIRWLTAIRGLPQGSPPA